MTQFSQGQFAKIGADVFRDRLRRSLARADQEFGGLAEPEQREFIELSHDQARLLGFRTEQGVAAYALGALWMGLDFEQGVPLLMTLLQAPVPEVRKVHGMSEWVHDQLGPHATPASGDDALRRSVQLTRPWGLQ